MAEPTCVVCKAELVQLWRSDPLQPMVIGKHNARLYPDGFHCPWCGLHYVHAPKQEPTDTEEP